MSNKEPDYQSDPGAVRGPKGEKTRGSKLDYDLIAAIFIMTMVLILIGMYAMFR